MNRCLHIPEIVFLICSHVSDDIVTIGVSGIDGEPYKNHLVPIDYENHDCEIESSRSSQLYALARTCRQFQQPALENLWESIPSIVPIIKCAGEELWKEDIEYAEEDLWMEESQEVKCVRLARPISTSDAETMKKYASFVTYLNTNGYPKVSPGIWTALQDTFAGTVLFPHLRGIEILGDQMMRCAALFGTQDLTSVTITPWISRPSMLVDFIARCPSLVTLHLPHATGPKLLETAIEALPNWQNLSRLVCHSTPDLLPAISRCTRLQCVEFHLTAHDDNWKLLSAEMNPRWVPPVLQTINITCDTMPHVIRFVDILPPSISIQNLDISTYKRDSTTEVKDWLTLLESLAKYSHSLKKLHVQDQSMYRIPRRIFSNTLLLNLAKYFVALTHVKILHFWDYDLVDEDLKQLTEALPLLEEFCLSIRASEKHIEDDFTIGTTAKCLSFFARNCPSLSNLCITFDGSGGIPDSQERFTPGLKLTSLDVSISPIHDEVEQVASFLLHLFPNLQRIKWEQYHLMRVEETEKRAYTMRLWSKVSKLLRRAIYCGVKSSQLPTDTLVV